MGHGRQQTWRHVCTIHLQRFLPDSAWENHFPPLSQPRPQKCDKMLLGNLAIAMIMGFLIFWYSTPKSLFLPFTDIVLKRLVKIFWNCCQGSKYGLHVKRRKRDRILISMFACWVTLSMWHKRKHIEDLHLLLTLESIWKCDAVAEFLINVRWQLTRKWM